MVTMENQALRMQVMQLSGIDVDRLSDRELADLATELWKRLAARGNALPALMIPGADQKPIGYLVPARGMGDSASPDAAFMAETMRRIQNPPERFLSVDEFLDALDEHWSNADSTGSQFDSANGHVGHAG
jgi:hypothetical protein